MSTNQVIDCLVNVHFGETEKQPTWMLKVRDDYFKGPESMFAPVDMSALHRGDGRPRRAQGRADGQPREAVGHGPQIRRSEAGPVRARDGRRQPASADAVAARAQRGGQRPSGRVCRCGAQLLGRRQYPPSDAVYYPLYTKCAEIGLPLCINTGLPGPPIPGEVQNPIHLDRVCVRFPELKLCMIHGADPWWDIAIRLLIKYSNLRLMTSAWSPKRLPDSLLHYMRTRGPDKVIYASDWPVLKMRRVVPEAQALDLPADVLENYLYNNAHTFFFEGDEEH